MSRTKTTPKISICPVCNIEFAPKPRQKYCCSKCQLQANENKRKEWLKANPHKHREYNRNKHETYKRPREINETGFKSNLSEKLTYASNKGVSYGDLQRAETLRMVGGVKI